MTIKNWLIAATLIAFGVMSLRHAIRAKRGEDKGTFIRPATPIYPKDGVYAAIPMGVGFLVMASGWIISFFHFDLGRQIGMWSMFIAIPLALILMAWRPNWLKPDWLLWLEENYDQSTIDFMFEQARQEKRWSQKVDTQTGLEAWAREMEQKYRSYIGDGYG
jgi:hypothetical protein